MEVDPLYIFCTVLSSLLLEDYFLVGLISESFYLWLNRDICKTYLEPHERMVLVYSRLLGR